MAWVKLVALALLACGGCTTVPLDAARRDFQAGRLETADRTLAGMPSNAYTVLNLMERGMIRHVRGDYTNSTADWLAAVRLEKALETHSAARAGASMLLNDNLLDFRGYPYERTYLHVFLAKNYLAQGLWEDAAVEARAIARQMEKLDGFPDDAYSHYVAGFCLELCGDFSNAAMQYRQVARILPECGIATATGRFPGLGLSSSPVAAPEPGCELVCFLDFDGHYGMIPESATLYSNGKVLGTSRTLVNVLQLEAASQKRMELRRTAKAVSRLALKGSLAVAAGTKNDDLGALLWLLLLATEQEDLRRWETLPARMAVARVPCPENLTEFQIEFQGYNGISLSSRTVVHPLVRKGRIYVSFCRDHP